MTEQDNTNLETAMHVAYQGDGYQVLGPIARQKPTYIDDELHTDKTEFQIAFNMSSQRDQKLMAYFEQKAQAYDQSATSQDHTAGVNTRNISAYKTALKDWVKQAEIKDVHSCELYKGVPRPRLLLTFAHSDDAQKFVTAETQELFTTALENAIPQQDTLECAAA